MNENKDKLEQLIDQLNSIIERQEIFSQEIADLRTEILKLKAGSEDQKPEIYAEEVHEIWISSQVNQEISEPEPIKDTTEQIPEVNDPEKIADEELQDENSSLEKFIGENLISKIGILITILGIGIGVKYSIDHQLISPTARILIGYFMGFGLLGIGLKLKKSYENYSAVLVSGAMATIYFITFFAFSFYNLLPEFLAFSIMVAVTVSTVYAALKYNRQIIAHIGLAGAYAVPFLISKDSGDAAFLFSYISIINIGILVISFKKDWNPLYYVSFITSWIIYFVWFNTSYKDNESFSVALAFDAIFYLIFYSTFLAYNLKGKSSFELNDRSILLANSSVFFTFGYFILQGNEQGKEFTGLFAAINALINLAVSILVYKQNLRDKNLFYFVSSLVILFLTIAFPIELSGKWLTVAWITEAALIFWIGRTKSEPVYEKLSYLIIILASGSLINDWTKNYILKIITQTDVFSPIINLNFLNSLFFIGSLGFINFWYFNKKYRPAFNRQIEIRQLLNFILPAALICFIYIAFRLEIAAYFKSFEVHHSLYSENQQPFTRTGDLTKFKALWMNIYSMAFLSGLSILNMLKIKNRILGFTTLGICAVVLVIFLLNDLFILGTLRETYLELSATTDIHLTAYYLYFRYISITFAVFLVYSIYKTIRQPFLKFRFEIETELLFHLLILWIASSELINWLRIGGYDEAYKLGLSIFFGLYSVMLISVGIWKKKKHLRIGAIVLFGATLVKLFIYDISQLETIPKTIVFVSLGVLLLIISFLYNKYKDIIL